MLWFLLRQIKKSLSGNCQRDFFVKLQLFCQKNYRETEMVLLPTVSSTV